MALINTLKLGENGYHFSDILQIHYHLELTSSVFIRMSLKFFANGPIDSSKPSLFKLIPWHGIGDKPLTVSMMALSIT